MRTNTIARSRTTNNTPGPVEHRTPTKSEITPLAQISPARNARSLARPPPRGNRRAPNRPSQP
eukprot:4784378-Lingulodinium_polyedra.AAC.1